MKIRPVGADLFHADGRVDGRTGMINLIIGFRNSEKAPKNCRKNLFLDLEGMKTIKQVEVIMASEEKDEPGLGADKSKRFIIIISLLQYIIK